MGPITRRGWLAFPLAGFAFDRWAIYRDSSAAYGYIQEGDYRRAWKLLSTRLEQARVLGEEADMAPVLGYIGMLLAEIGNAPAAFRLLEAAARSSMTITARAPFALRDLAQLRLEAHDHASAAETAAQALKNATNPQDVPATSCNGIAALAAARAGDAPRAAMLLKRTLERIPRKLDSWNFTGPRLLFNVALTRAIAGQLNEARDTATRGLELASRKKPSPRSQALGELALSEIALMAGDWREGNDRSRRALDIVLSRFGYRHQDASRAMYLSSRAFQAAGQREDALTRAKDSAAIAALVFGKDSQVAKDRRKHRDELAG